MRAQEGQKHEVKIRGIAGRTDSLVLECSCGHRDYFGTPNGASPKDTRCRAERYAKRHVEEKHDASE